MGGEEAATAGRSDGGGAGRAPAGGGDWRECALGCEGFLRWEPMRLDWFQLQAFSKSSSASSDRKHYVVGLEKYAIPLIGSAMG